MNSKSLYPILSILFILLSPILLSSTILPLSFVYITISSLATTLASLDSLTLLSIRLPAISLLGSSIIILS